METELANVETGLPTAEAPAPAPEPTAEPTATPDAEAPVETESAEAEVSPPLSFNEWWEEQSKDNEALRSSYELHIDEAKESGRREAQSQLQPKLDRMHATFQNYHRAAGEIAQGIAGIREELGNWLQDNGVDQRGIQKVFQSLYQSNPQMWQSLTNMGQTAGGFSALRGVALTLGGELSGDAGKAFSEKYLQEFSNAEGGVGSAVDVLKEMANDWAEARIEKATQPLRNRIKALEAEIEKGKVASRQSGPDSVPKTGSGTGLTYKQLMAMSPDDYEAVPAETRRKLFAEEHSRRSG